MRYTKVAFIFRLQFFIEEPELEREKSDISTGARLDTETGGKWSGSLAIWHLGEEKREINTYMLSVIKISLKYNGKNSKGALELGLHL